MKTIYLAYSCRDVPAEFQRSMLTTVAEIAALPNITIRHSGEHPNVTALDVDWYEHFTDIVRDVSLVIAVLDFRSAVVDRLIFNRSVFDLPLWCFFPRGTIVPLVVSQLMNRHVERLQKKAVQRAYPYDHPSNISSWVASTYAREPEAVREAAR